MINAFSSVGISISVTIGAPCRELPLFLVIPCPDRRKRLSLSNGLSSIAVVNLTFHEDSKWDDGYGHTLVEHLCSRPSQQLRRRPRCPLQSLAHLMECSQRSKVCLHSALHLLCLRWKKKHLQKTVHEVKKMSSFHNQEPTKSVNTAFTERLARLRRRIPTVHHYSHSQLRWMGAPGTLTLKASYPPRLTRPLKTGDDPYRKPPKWCAAKRVRLRRAHHVEWRKTLRQVHDLHVIQCLRGANKGGIC